MALVFQYGSNATRARLNGPRRLNGHASDRGLACTAVGFDIAFDVMSNNNGCAACDLIPVPGRIVWGVLYDIKPGLIRGHRQDGQKTLAEIEGGSYQEMTVRVADQAGEQHDAVTFVVRPDKRITGIPTSAAYVSWIVYGLRDHGVSENYLAHVIDVAIQTNESAQQSAIEQIRLIKNL
jgi:hypothetical protein